MNQGRLIFRQLTSGEWIPFINGKALHSTTRPLESEKIFISNYRDEIKNAKNILVFGLGIGLHIDAIKDISTELGLQKNICVIEPNKQLIDKYEKFSKNSRPYIFYSESPEELFYKDEFINFLLLSPLVIVHPPSIEAHKNYFDSVHSYRPPEFLKKEFSTFRNKISFPAKKNESNHTNSDDLLSSALIEMKKSFNGDSLI